MTKPYKAATPEQTVDRIKCIIAHHCLPVEEQLLGDGDMFCSCRISLANGGDTSIGTNGKGMRMDYALASGYAEFMERLQNRVLVYPNPANIGQRCRFFCDERDYSYDHEQGMEVIRRFAPMVIPQERVSFDRLEGKEVPFYHYNSGTCRYVPYSLIRWLNGSNGMCAGNIPEEAVIQGFNEIFERYCIQRLYLDRLTPPDIPAANFEGTEILERLRRMKREFGYDFAVKDCSLGEGYPVLGLLIYSPDRAKYIFHLGADLSAVTALERCFTEVFQGYTGESLRFENDINRCERLDLFNEFKRSLMHGRGRMHAEFFGSEPSYPFTGHGAIPVGKDFREDCANICRWLISRGYEIYIRDNSFLGFPTFHIVVPGLSEINAAFCNLQRRITHMTATENRLNPLYHLPSVSEEEARRAIEFLHLLHGDAIDLMSRNSARSNHVNRHLILALLRLLIADKDGAEASLERYEESYREAGKTPNRTFSNLLACLKGEECDDPVAHKIMADPRWALQNIGAPECFRCDDCKISGQCSIELLRQIEERMQEAMEQYNFRQYRFPQADETE